MKPFTITRSTVTKAEMRLQLANPDDTRGASLAMALHGRREPGLNCWFLTPVRAQKWRKLYCAGFAAEWVMRDGQMCWRFDRPPQKLRLKLHHAIYIARALADQGLSVIHSEVAA